MMKFIRFAAAASACVILSVVTASAAFAADGWQKNAEEKWIYYEADQPVKNKWLEQDGHWMRTNSKGEMVRNTSAVVDGKHYAFDTNGYLLKGGWVSVQPDREDPSKPARTVWYYADNDGVLLTDGWHEVDGCVYYFNASGAATKNGVVTIGEDKFYVEEGVGKRGTAPGWFSVDVTNSNGTVTTWWYYAKADGSILYDGWYEADGHTVYFDKSGRGQFNKWFKIDEVNVLVDANGDRLGPGWCSLELVNSKGEPYTNWYYVKEDMSRGENGFLEIGGEWYYFDKNGVNYRKRWLTHTDGKKYYFDENGVMKRGGWFTIDSTNASTGVTRTYWYYADAEGSVYFGGDHEIDGKNYYFADNGVNLRKNFQKVGKRRRYFGEDGAMKRDEWFSTTSETTVTGPGTMMMEIEDLVQVKETWYYADGEGFVVTRSDQEIDGAEYRINKNGVMVTGWQRDKQGEYTYYGKDGAKAYGWLQYELEDSWLQTQFYADFANKYGKYVWFYMDPDNNGNAVRSKVNDYGEVVVDGHVYAANKRGVIQYGWAKVLPRNARMGAYHYYMPEAKDGFLQGERAVNTWVCEMPPADDDLEVNKEEKTWFYLDGAGNVRHAELTKNQILTEGGRTCLFDDYGRTLPGLAVKPGKNIEVREVYYFDPENGNALAKGLTEVTLPDGRKEMYYFQNSGAGLTGELDGYLYYKGRRQTGSGTRAVYYSKNEDSNSADVIVEYLVDAEGKILKNAVNVQGEAQTDGQGNGRGEAATFSSDEKGHIVAISGARPVYAVGPSGADLKNVIGTAKERGD